MSISFDSDFAKANASIFFAAGVCLSISVYLSLSEETLFDTVVIIAVMTIFVLYSCYTISLRAHEWQKQDYIFMNELPIIDSILLDPDKETADIALQNASREMSEKYNISSEILVFSFISNILKNSSGDTSITDRLSIISNVTHSALDRIDADLTVARYIVWLVPTIGFLGTVWGIRHSFGSLGRVLTPGDGRAALDDFLSNFSVAFETTIVALLFSAVIYGILTVHENYRHKLVLTVSTYFRSDEKFPRTSFNSTQDVEAFEDALMHMRKIMPQLMSVSEAMRFSFEENAKLGEKFVTLQAAHQQSSESLQNVIINQIEVLSDNIKTSHAGQTEKIVPVLNKIEEKQARRHTENQEYLSNVAGAVSSLIELQRSLNAILIEFIRSTDTANKNVTEIKKRFEKTDEELLKLRSWFENGPF